MLNRHTPQVLHATPVINETLSNVRKLLHPHGKLFLQELSPSKSIPNFQLPDKGWVNEKSCQERVMTNDR